MNVKIGTEAAQFPEKEYINGIFVAVPLNVKYMLSPAPLHSAVYGRRAVTPGPDYAYSYSTDYATALPDYAFSHRNILSRHGRPPAKKLHFYTRLCLCQLEGCSKILSSSIRMWKVQLAPGLYSTHY
jgi:hypothetical protein